MVELRRQKRCDKSWSGSLAKDDLLNWKEQLGTNPSMQTEATEEIFMPQNFIVVFGRKTRYNIELNAVQRKELCIKMFNVVQKREIYENISLIFQFPEN